MRKLLRIFALFLLIIMSSTDSVYALEIDPEDFYRPYHIVLGDGLIFHVTPPGGEAFGFIGYPETGLYQDGVLIYAVEGRDLFDSLFFSEDAMSFLEISPWLGSERTVVRFYHQGVLVHDHPVRYFLRDETALAIPDFLPPSWHVRDQTYYDRANNMLQITTVEGRELTFDLSTGLVVSNEEDCSIGMIGLGIVIVAFVLLLFTVIRRKRAE